MKQNHKPLGEDPGKLFVKAADTAVKVLCPHFTVLLMLAPWMLHLEWELWQATDPQGMKKKNSTLKMLGLNPGIPLQHGSDSHGCATTC